MKGIGIPLQNFKQRWDQLEDYCGQQHRDRMANKISYTNEDPGNPDYNDAVFQYTDSEDSDDGDNTVGQGRDSKTRAAPSGSVTHPANTCLIQTVKDLTIFDGTGGLRRLRLIAQRHITACSEDWEAGSQHQVYALLMRFIKGEASALVRAYEVLQILTFREEAMDLADIIIDRFHLVRPSGGKYCADWPQYDCLDSAEKSGNSSLVQRYEWCLKKLEKGCLLEPVEGQGLYFYKPTCYIAAALASSCLGKEDVRNRIDKIAKFLVRTMEPVTERVADTERVQRAAGRWFRDTGRSLRKGILTGIRSFSPSKVSQASTRSPKKTVSIPS
jgi:hypothetical protein